MNNVNTGVNDSAITALVARPIAAAGNVQYDNADNRLTIQLDGIAFSARGTASEMKKTLRDLRDGLTKAIGG